MTKNHELIRGRLSQLSADIFHRHEVALTKYQASINADNLQNARTAIGAADIAVLFANEGLNEMATKYLNDCSYSLIDPLDRIEAFTEPAQELLVRMKTKYVQGRSGAAAFGDQSEFIRLFTETFAQAEQFLERLTDDVRHGEVGTRVIYRHTPPLQRHWDAWGKDLTIAFLGGVVGALATVSIS